MEGVVGKNDPPPPPVEEKNDPGGTISISGNAFGENTKVTRGRREREGGERERRGRLWRFTTQTATRINIQAGASTD